MSYHDGHLDRETKSHPCHNLVAYKFRGRGGDIKGIDQASSNGCHHATDDQKWFVPAKFADRACAYEIEERYITINLVFLF